MQAVKSKIASTDKDKILMLMRGLNIFNGLLLALACFFAFTIIKGSVTRFFLALYIGIFALLLLAFELRVNRAEQSIKRFFGFMYTYMGRTTFLLFLGAINFGMIDDSNKGTDGRTVVIIVGIATVANAAFNCLVICNHPAFVQSKSKPMTEEEIIAYIKAHPEVAAKAAAEQTFDTPQPVDHTTIDVFGSAPAGAAGASTASPAMAAPVPAPAAADSGAYVPPSAGVDTSSGFSSVPLSSSPAPALPRRGASSPAAADAPAPAAASGGALPPPLPPRNKKKSTSPAAAPSPAAGESNPFNPDNPFE